jgi:cytochrome P450 monooxygenase
MYACTEFIFGESADSQLPGDPNDSAGFLKAMTDGFIEIGKRRNAGRIAPILFFFDKKWKTSYDKLHSYIDVYVKRALEATAPDIESKQESTDNKKPPRYILANEMAKKIRDPITLRFQILNVFIAARNTTSILMANALFHLARHPHIWTELRSQSLALGDQTLTFELLKSLQFFKHVIWETVRLTGPSGRIQRRAIRNTILPVGGGDDGKAPVFLEKGTVVSMDLYSLHHDKDIWGEDAGEFNPRRWVGKRPMWEFVPFLGGPRMCPAQQQVLTQSVFLLVRMTRELAGIENRDTCWEYVEIPKAVAESRNGVKVAFTS